MVIKRFLRKVGFSLEYVLGEFEILSVCFSKEDMDIGVLRKIELLENFGRRSRSRFFLEQEHPSSMTITILYNNMPPYTHFSYAPNHN